MAEADDETPLHEQLRRAAIHFATQMTMDEAQVFDRAVETLRDLADECPDLDPEDSRRLRELRSAIDDHLGWPDPESEERGDYVGRVREVAVALENAARRLHLLEGGPTYGESWFNAILRETTSIVRLALRFEARPRG